MDTPRVFYSSGVNQDAKHLLATCQSAGNDPEKQRKAIHRIEEFLHSYYQEGLKMGRSDGR